MERGERGVGYRGGRRGGEREEKREGRKEGRSFVALQLVPDCLSPGAVIPRYPIVPSCFINS